jgi:hypothetical protein
MPRSLTLLKTTEQVVQVDQGVRDVYYNSQFTMSVRIDNGVFDQYTVTVKSAVFDQYDHKNATWGAFQVLEVSCTMN